MSEIERISGIDSGRYVDLQARFVRFKKRQRARGSKDGGTERSIYSAGELSDLLVACEREASCDRYLEKFIAGNTSEQRQVLRKNSANLRDTNNRANNSNVRGDGIITLLLEHIKSH